MSFWRRNAFTQLVLDSTDMEALRQKYGAIVKDTAYGRPSAAYVWCRDEFDYPRITRTVLLRNGRRVQMYHLTPDDLAKGITETIPQHLLDTGIAP